MINSITSILWDGFASITFVIVFHISNIFRFSKAFCSPLSVYVWGLISFKMCLKGNLQDPWHTGQIPYPPQISICINGYMYLSKLSHVSVKSQGQSAGSMAQRPDPIPSPQQYHPAKGQHPVEHVGTAVNSNKRRKATSSLEFWSRKQPEGQGSKLALLAFPPGTRSSPAVGHCSTVSAQLGIIVIRILVTIIIIIVFNMAPLHNAPAVD